MNMQFILLAQSVTTAVLEIILLLLGAAVIGFLTAWYYQKSHYVPIVKKLEEEKADLNNQISGLKNDISRLNDRISGLEKTIEEKNKEIAGFKKQKE